MGKLEFRLLGPPEVWLDGSPLAFRTRKALALLAYLATEEGSHPREELAKLLWPRSEGPKSRTALRSVLTNLRGALREAENPGGTPLRVERDSLSFDASGARIDLAVLRSAYEEAARTFSGAGPPRGAARRRLVGRLGDAVEAYRGEFLEGFYLNDAPEFDYWASLEREGWRARVGFVFDRLSELLLEGGETAEAVDVAERWVDHDPLSEPARERLMRARYVLGDTAGALLAYEEYRRILKEDLGSEPGPELEALAMLIRSQRTSVRGTPRRAAGKVGFAETPFVGRAEEFGALAEEYYAARAGGLRIVILLGEAGIGKTRLGREFFSWAEVEGTDAMYGGSSAGIGGLPYGSLVDAVRPRVERERAPDDLLEDVWLSELSRLLPELKERYPDLPSPTSDETTAKGRLYEAVCRLLAALSERAPVVLFVDDLHWADTATLDVLAYVAKHLSEGDAPVLVVLAAREEELAADGLSGWLASLRRVAPVKRLELGPLSDEDTLRLVRMLAASDEGHRTPGDLLEDLSRRLHADTRGQPFFLAQTLKALFERGVLVTVTGEGGRSAVEVVPTAGDRAVFDGLLPPGVRELIRERLSGLSLAASELLSAGAILGDGFDFQLLRRVAELEEREGLAALDEVLARRLLQEIGDEGSKNFGGYAFAHDKIRDVVYTEAGEARRRVLHRWAIEILAEEGAPSADLARHALAAGITGVAFRHLLDAGDAAMALFAVEDAIGHYERARGLLEEMRGSGTRTIPPASEIERLYANLGRAYELAGGWDRARATYDRMRSCARDAGEPTVECIALNHLAVLTAGRSFDVKGATALLEEALEVAEKGSEQAALVETECNLAEMVGSYGWEPGPALPHAERALALARESGRPELLARSLRALARVAAHAGRWEQTVEYAQEARALYAELASRPPPDRAPLIPTLVTGAPPSRGLGYRALELDCLNHTSIGETLSGQPRVGLAAAREAMALALQINSVQVEVTSTLTLSAALLDLGEYEEAFAVSERGVDRAHTLTNPFLLFFMLVHVGLSHQSLMRLDEARAAYEEALEESETLGGGAFEALAAGGLCAALALAGEWPEAHACALRALSARNYDVLMVMDLARYRETEALLRGGDEDRAREDVRLFGQRADDNERYRITYLSMLAVLDGWDGEPERAIERLREAEWLAGKIGLPGELWRIRSALGELHEELGAPEAAREAYKGATGVVQRLAGGLSDEGLKKGFLDAPQVRRALEKG